MSHEELLFPHAIPVERLALSSLQSFELRQIEPLRPVILTGAMTGWPALTRWNPGYIRAKVGDRKVPVFISHSQVFSPAGEKVFEDLRREMTVTEYLDQILGGSGDGLYRYLATVSIPDLLPPLLDDIGFAPVFQGEPAHTPCIWFGAGGTVSPLHFDPFGAHNFLSQVMGYKRLVMFSPEDSARLYPYGPERRLKQFSQVDLSAPDLERFPEFPQAQPYECILAPGEILLIPLGWWHQVYSLELNISVNVWWTEQMLASSAQEVG